MIRSTSDRDAEELIAAQRRQAGASEEPPVLVLVNVVRRNLLVIVAAVVMGLAAGVVWTILTPRLYTAEAVVRVPTPVSSDDAAGAAAAPNLAEYRPILLNRQSVATVLAKYHLDQQWRVDRFIDAACSFDVVKGTSVATVAVTLGDPQLAANVANDLVSEGIKVSRGLNAQELNTTQGQYADVLTKAAADEEGARKRYVDYRKTAQIEALRADAFKLVDERATLMNVTTEIAEKRGALERATLERNARPELISAERAVAGDPSMQEVVRDASGRSAAGVKMNEQSVNEVRQELDLQVGTLTAEVAGLEKKRSELIEKYGVGAATLSKLNELYEKEVELKRREADYEIAKKAYDDALGYFSKMTASVMQHKTDILLEDKAIPPSLPNSRDALTKLIVSLAAMLSIAAIVIAWREAARYARV